MKRHINFQVLPEIIHWKYVESHRSTRIFFDLNQVFHSGLQDCPYICVVGFIVPLQEKLCCTLKSFAGGFSSGCSSRIGLYLASSVFLSTLSLLLTPQHYSDGFAFYCGLPVAQKVAF